MGDATTSLVEAIWPVKSTEVVYCSNAIMDRYVEACLSLGPVAKGRQCVDSDSQPSQTCGWNTEDENG
jgi:hypothetical protein